MGLRRGLKPAAGVVLGLGAVVVALDADSEARRRAAALRREVLETALRRRLHGGATPATPAPGRRAAVSRPRFYVVTGPDDHLTSLGRESVSHALLCGRAEAALHLHSQLGAKGNDDDDGVLSRRSVRLTVPHDLTLGTGQFSLLVEQQLLRSQDAAFVEQGGSSRGICGGGDSSEPGLRAASDEPVEPGPDGVDGLEQPHQQQHIHHPWENKAGEVKPEEAGSPLWPPSAVTATPTATVTQIPPPVSTWESLLLWATLVILDGQQLDDAALWALERALSGMETDDDINNQESLTAAAAAHKSCNFVLEIVHSAASEGVAVGERSEPGALCGDLARLGWRVASLGLGSVVAR